MSEQISDEAFFRAEGDHFLPCAVSSGPWGARSLMGRVVVGLIGHVIERRHLVPGFVPARLTVDLHRLPGFEPIVVETRVLRSGGRLMLVEVDLVSGGVPCAHAVCQLLAETPPPPGTVWSPPGWSAPSPDRLARDERYDKWRVHPIVGRTGHVGPKQAWLSDRLAVVEGVPLTPFTRVALAVDFVSPFSHIGDAGAQYINTDVSLHLRRLPQGEWIGFDVQDHQADKGIAVGHCRLHDARGPIGFGSAAAIAQRR